MDERRPFTRADAVAAGISPWLLRGSRYRRIFWGVFISAEVEPTDEERVIGALLVHPAGAWASHRTAAAWCGVVVPDSSFVHVSVTKAKDRRWLLDIKPHVAPVGTPTRMWRGIRVSDPVRMFVELASMLDLVDLVVAGDNLLRVFRMTAATLRAGLERTRDYWSPAARHAAAYVRDGVDSPMETRLRMLIVLAGLPEPVAGHAVRADNGDVLVRFDLAYREQRLAIEYHGTHHRDDPRTWERDLRRSELVDQLGWHLVHVTSKDLFDTPAGTLRRIWLAAARLGLTVPPPQPGWEPHFTNRAPRPAS
ncbi:hypothetical protein [Nocardioides sp. Arc9.136]|uniref:hypothetical protein n=1 Tax=Nocardioides sp. Arc9.136 TaxID=2996826 RepID=UPI00266531FB|nr:hypothetical protein [Nocardioides sp. Arc9.136]WKN48530.1 hypothetical protein OSR43_21220 [Nocardioides sp. Arc9.136]